MRAADTRKGAGGGICPVPETQPSQHRSWICKFAATEVSNTQASSSSLTSARHALGSAGGHPQLQQPWGENKLRKSSTGLMLAVNSRLASLSICRIFPPGPSEDIGSGSHLFWTALGLGSALTASSPRLNATAGVELACLYPKKTHTNGIIWGHLVILIQYRSLAEVNK